MAELNSLGMHPVRVVRPPAPPLIQVLEQRPLHRIMSFTGRSIDDVVNSPIVKNEIRGYYKLHKLIQRRSEIVELEQQWNALGR